MVSIIWFRQDLRLSDNPALHAAVARMKSCGGKLLAVYIDDQKWPKASVAGAASRCWLHHSLLALDHSLNGRLLVCSGDPAKILAELAEQTGADSVYWNRCYEPWQVQRDKQIKAKFKQRNIACQSFNGSLLWEPWQVLKKDQTPYKVFTPFYRRGCLSAQVPREPLPAVDLNQDQLFDISQLTRSSIDQLKLLPEHNWADDMLAHWQNTAGELQIGESAAKQRLATFLNQGLAGYKQGRDFPSQSSVSRLSPHLHFGEISANQVWYAATDKVLADSGADTLQSDLDHFHSELAWREFSYYLLYHFPEIPTENFQKKFNNFQWKENEAYLLAWKRGQTGIPIIDAGMRELWQTGYMHNRVRMLVGSFLVKNLLQPWQEGASWFFDCLVDADLASNSASWQWVAGSGADAAPYFRIFNPVTQAAKFDANGEYIRRYVPEIAALPNKYLFDPSNAPDDILQQANIKLGKDYPFAMVDLKASRERALAKFKDLGSAIER